MLSDRFDGLALIRDRESELLRSVGASTERRRPDSWEDAASLWAILADQNSATLSPVASHRIAVGGHEVNYICGPLPKPIWDSLPLREHQCLPFSEVVRTAVESALRHLSGSVSTLFADNRGFLKNIVWLDRDPSKKGGLITSVSIPALPLTSFFSDMALHHIPPNTVKAGTSSIFLAENILHEAVHNRINMTVLEKEIFDPDFDTETSPRIPIPWRAYGEERNRDWQIDRAFHALGVYAYLLAYRREVLRFFPDAEDADLIRTALVEAESATAYLVEQLAHYSRFLAPQGVALVRGFEYASAQ